MARLVSLGTSMAPGIQTFSLPVLLMQLLCLVRSEQRATRQALTAGCKEGLLIYCPQLMPLPIAADASACSSTDATLRLQATVWHPALGRTR